MISKESIMPVSSVQTVINKCKIRGSVKTKPRSRRPRVRVRVSKSTRKILQDARKNLHVITSSSVTAAEIQISLTTSGVAVSIYTIRRHLQKNGLHGRVTRRKPLLYKCHKVSHLQAAQRQAHNFWNKVIWIDETKTELFGYNHKC